MISLVPILACLSALAQVWCVTPLSRFAIDMHFEDFIHHHNKIYKDFQERQKRYLIFTKNLQKLHESGRLSPNGIQDHMHYLDYSLEDFVMKFGGFNFDEKVHSCQILTDSDVPNSDLPVNFDWRTRNVVTPVKNQGECGSCYAFSVTGNIEGQYALKYGHLVQLSKQQIVDCDRGSNVCKGGFLPSALSYLMAAGGSKLEKDYPYLGYNSHPQCSLRPNQDVVKVAGCHVIKLSSQEKLKQLLYHRGPLSVAIKMEVLFGAHKGEIIQDRHCSGPINHAVLLVGYGEENGIPYWILKNSWGPERLDDGYFRLQRGEGLDSCGIMSGVKTSAIVA